MRNLPSTLLLLLAVSILPAPEVPPRATLESLTFKSPVLPPVFRLPPALQSREALFRMGLNTLAEGVLVMGVLDFGQDELRLSETQSASLAPLMEKTYQAIHSDPLFAQVPSALGYCFATTQVTTGHYFMYRPAAPIEPTQCLVLLHGFGGNFLFYTWLLKEEFPNAVILVPSWGVSWAKGPPEYLTAMLADARERLGRELPKPFLLGVSAGAYGGFPLYQRLSETFAGYISLAGVPASEVLKSMSPKLRLAMINGTADDMFPIASARQQAKLLQERVPSLLYRELAGDHFFILSQRAATMAIVRDFMAATPAKP